MVFNYYTAYAHFIRGQNALIEEMSTPNGHITPIAKA